MALSNPELYRLISEFRVDDATAPKSFSRRLQKEHGWSPDFTALAVREYLRFMYLARTASGGVSPSQVVDEVWHLHLTFTRSYWKELCGEILGKEIHHDPGTGLPGESFRDVFAETLALYRQEFDQDPPALIWQPAPQKKQNTGKLWLGVAAGFALLAVGCASENGSDPGFSTIFGLFMLLAVGGFIAGIFGIWRLIRGGSPRQGYRESSCGTDFIIESSPIIIHSDSGCSAPPVEVSCSASSGDSSPSDGGSSASSSCSSSSSSCSSSSCSSSSCSSS